MDMQGLNWLQPFVDNTWKPFLKTTHVWCLMGLKLRKKHSSCNNEQFYATQFPNLNSSIKLPMHQMLISCSVKRRNYWNTAAEQLQPDSKPDVLSCFRTGGRNLTWKDPIIHIAWDSFSLNVLQNSPPQTHSTYSKVKLRRFSHLQSTNRLYHYKYLQHLSTNPMT